VLESAEVGWHDERFGVGGFLADEKLAMQGYGDCHYRNEKDGRSLLVVEYKRGTGFDPANQLWHHKSRGAQLYGALFKAAVDEKRAAKITKAAARPGVGMILVPTAFRVVLLEPLRFGESVRWEVHLYPESTRLMDTITEEFEHFLCMCLSRAELQSACTPPRRERKKKRVSPTEPSTKERMQNKLSNAEDENPQMLGEMNELASTFHAREQAWGSFDDGERTADGGTSFCSGVPDAHGELNDLSIVVGADERKIWLVPDDECNERSDDGKIEGMPEDVCVYEEQASDIAPKFAML
jgi:hypothetical protein